MISFNMYPDIECCVFLYMYHRNVSGIHTRNIFWPRHVFAGICKILRDSPKNTKIVPPLLKKLSINIDRIN